MKHAMLTAFHFNSLPGHVNVTARGTGNTTAVALKRAIATMLKDKRLKHRKLEHFRIDVVIANVCDPARKAE